MKRLSVSSIVMLMLVSQTHAVSLEWVRQLGTTSNDIGWGVSADSLGNAYISGYTGGSLGGPNAGGGHPDAFVSKYDSAGVLQWTRQLGTGLYDLSNAVSADGLGNVYISGQTEGDLAGPNAGSNGSPDAFVSKYNAAGVFQWTRQLGTAANDFSLSVSADGLGDVYISGHTNGSLGGPNAGNSDVFVSKYDASGNQQWTRQLGTNVVDMSGGISADGSGNVYVSGYTYGSLGGANAGDIDAFVSKYDATGVIQWTRQFGTDSGDYARGVSADNLGSVYVSGMTQGSLGGPNAGDGDVFVRKYDANGNHLWTRQLGTASGEDAAAVDNGGSVSADGLGNVYISGSTLGNLGGTNAGNIDAFVSKYDSAGSLLWTQQLGTAANENWYGWGVSADGLGNVYISGDTYGSLGGPNAGDADAYIAKYSDPIVPEPSSIVLVGLAIVGLMFRRGSLRVMQATVYLHQQASV